MYLTDLNNCWVHIANILLNRFILFFCLVALVQTVLVAQEHVYNGTKVLMWRSDANMAVYGNWAENGIFRKNKGSVFFNGSKRQKIEGLPVDFENFELNNTKGLDIGLYLGISKNFNFKQGVLHTPRNKPEYLVDFADTAHYTNANDDKHIDGYVAKILRDSFNFPTGDDVQLRPAIITSQDTKWISNIVCYYRANPNTNTLPLGGPFNTALKQDIIQKISQTEYWHIKGDAPVSITLTWNASSNISDLTNGEINKLVVVGWSSTSAQWVSLGNFAMEGDLTSGRITSRIVVPDDFIVFTLAVAYKDVRCATSVTSVKINGSTTICNNRPITLDAGTNYTRYRWSTGEETPTIKVNSAGKYFVIAWDSCNVAHSDTVSVKVTPSVRYTIKNASCYGRSDGAIAIFSDTIGMSVFLNNERVSFNTLRNLPAATYSFKIETPKYCSVDTTIIIKEPIKNAIQIVSDSILVYPNSVVKLKTQSIDSLYKPAFWQWFPPEKVSCINCVTTTAAVPFESTYKVVTLDSLGCSANAEIIIKVRGDDGHNLYVPNIFKPEKEEYTVLGNPDKVTVLRMQIFDRWGELLFDASNFRPDGSVTWDGSYRGKPLSLGTYVVIVEALFKDGFRKKYARDLVLIR